MFSPSGSIQPKESLDDLLLSLEPIWKKAQRFLALDSLIGWEAELHLLKDEAMALNLALATWQEAQVKESSPTTVGHVTSKQTGPGLGVGCWPGRVDVYFDLYIAGVWNTCRTVRCFLLDLILQLVGILSDNKDHICEQKDAINLLEGILASIPYHLTEDLQLFLQDAGKGTRIMNPGRPVGGLLLMHPLFLVLQLSIIPPQVKEYIKTCLAWIGAHMGIGQASIFARVRILTTPLYFILLIKDFLKTISNFTRIKGSSNPDPALRWRLYDCLGRIACLIIKIFYKRIKYQNGNIEDKIQSLMQLQDTM